MNTFLVISNQTQIFTKIAINGEHTFSLTTLLATYVNTASEFSVIDNAFLFCFHFFQKKSKTCELAIASNICIKLKKTYSCNKKYDF